MEFKEVLNSIRYLVCRGTPVQKWHSAYQSEFNAAYLEGIFHHNNKDFKCNLFFNCQSPGLEPSCDGFGKDLWGCLSKDCQMSKRFNTGHIENYTKGQSIG